jgi:hypothetical protein
MSEHFWNRCRLQNISFLLVRHGEPERDEKGEKHSLTQHGRTQVQKTMSLFLDEDVAYSPAHILYHEKARSIETAQIIADTLQTDTLCEKMDMLSNTHAAARAIFRKWYLAPFAFLLGIWLMKIKSTLPEHGSTLALLREKSGLLSKIMDIFIDFYEVITLSDAQKHIESYQKRYATLQRLVVFSGSEGSLQIIGRGICKKAFPENNSFIAEIDSLVLNHGEAILITEDDVKIIQNT